MHGLKRLAALAPTLMLAACVTTTDIAGTSPVVVDTSCQAFEPIRWSADDTDETLRQVREHNAAWRALCGGGP